MKNKKLIRFVQSLIMLPLTTVSGLPVGPITSAAVNIVSGPQSVLSQKLNNTEAISQEDKAAAIDAYFESHDMPLKGMGLKMVQEAEKNGLDWRLLPAIAVRESTGGKFACKKVEFSYFGWGSCKISFKSHAEAIETVARNLGGNNPNTAKHYDDKTTLQILRAYNPPSIVPRYAEQVMAIMNAIGGDEATITLKS